MTLEFTCPACGHRNRVPEESGEISFACSNCHTFVEMSEPVYEAEEVAPPQSIRSAEKPVSPESAPRQERRPCPYCRELIVRGARKCRYCGEILDDSLENEEETEKRSAPQKPEVIDYLFAVLCPPIVLFVGFVELIQRKKRAVRLLLLGLVSGLLYTGLGFLLNFLNR